MQIFGSREVHAPFFSRPMGERGSAHKPSVIQIFAYAGYKEVYMGGFSSDFFWTLFTSGRPLVISLSLALGFVVVPTALRSCESAHPPSSPLTPSINNSPPPFRAEIVPEAPFEARSGYTCRRARCESRTPSREARSQGTTTRSGKSQLPFLSLGFV